MKVLMFVGNLRASNGVTSFVMSYFRKLDPTKVQMDFVLMNDVPSPYYDEIIERGSKIFILPPINNVYHHYQECKKILRDGDYDVVCDNILIKSIPMMLAAKKCGVPVRILHSHNTKLSTSIKKERITKLLLPLLKREITDYCACGQLAGEALFGKAKFTVIPNVIAPETNTFDKVKRDKIRKELGVDDKVVVGTVGRTSIQKNPYFAIDVIEKVHQTNPSIVYWWIGSGELDDQLRAYVKKKGLGKVVSFLGSRDDVQDLYQAMDVLFLPSLFEGLPLTGVEAQAMGLPSILSASVTDELVYTDLVEYVSLDEPIEEWEKAFKKAIERIPQRRAYTEELKQSVYSAEDAGKNMTKIYEDLLASKLR